MPMKSRTSDSELKLALLINMIAPARLALYAGLAEYFNLLILHGGREANRSSWSDVDKKVPAATVKRAWGWQFRIARKVAGRLYEYKFLHLTPGYILELLKFRPDVLVTNEMGFRTIVALTFGIVFRKPVWVWWGGTIHTEREISIHKRLIRWLISRVAGHWISYGQSSTAYLRTLGIDPNSILEIQNCVDEKRFLTVTEPAFQLQPRPVVLHVGQLTARKGIECLLKAASILQEEGANFSLLFVGDGPDERVLQQRVSELGLGHVYFHRSFPPEQMNSVYRSADVLIFPTLEDVWGLVANEAILSGLPVLCSKYAGCARELFDDNNICDPLDDVEFVGKLRAAIAGQLPKTSPARLRKTKQLLHSLVEALQMSVRPRSRYSANVIVRRLD